MSSEPAKGRRRATCSVIEPCGSPTVLVVDSDPALLFWLGDILTEAFCKVVPALNCTEAASIVTRLSLKLDILIVNPVLAGVSELIETLWGASGQLKVIALCAGSEEIIKTLPAHAILRRPSDTSEPLLRQEWLERVRQILREVQTRDAG